MTEELPRLDNYHSPAIMRRSNAPQSGHEAILTASRSRIRYTRNGIATVLFDMAENRIQAKRFGNGALCDVNHN
jgi:hypothetical protein